MTDSISFVNNEWLWQITLITFVIWLVFIWKERSKTKKRGFYINCISGFIGLLSLALMALKPVASSSSKSFNAVILTKDFNNVQLDSLKNIHKMLTVYNYEENQAIIPKGKNLDTIFILGNGLQPYDLWQLNSKNTFYIGGKTPRGISQFTYNIKNTVGDNLLFNGRYRKPTKGHTLLLEDPSGQALDSITLNSQNLQDFQLSTNLKAKGDFIYQLVEKDSIGEVINKNPIPILIEEQSPLQILIVNAMPSFETKYLKNYLAEAGHGLVVRSKLTKNRYKYEYFNMDTKPTVRFSQDELKSFDLVIVDFLTLNSLSENAKNTLESSIKNDGLGVFIQPDISLYNAQNRWYTFNFTSDNKQTVALNRNPKSKVSKYPFVFKNDFSIEPILSDNSSILIAYKRLGIGRIGTSVFINTFELQLNGNTEAYKQLWAKTIENISSKSIPNIEWLSKSPLAYQNEPFSFKLRTNKEHPSVITNGYKIPIKQDITIEGLWEGTTYPKTLGWNTLVFEQDSTEVFKYFVTDTAKWQTVKTTNNININKKYFDANEITQNTINKKEKPINLFWFFAVFILCIGYLWLEPKL